MNACCTLPFRLRLCYVPAKETAGQCLCFRRPRIVVQTSNTLSFATRQCRGGTLEQHQIAKTLILTLRQLRTYLTALGEIELTSANPQANHRRSATSPQTLLVKWFSAPYHVGLATLDTTTSKPRKSFYLGLKPRCREDLTRDDSTPLHSTL